MRGVVVLSEYVLERDSPLLRPIEVGGLELPNRLLMAPLTRSRALEDGTPSRLQGVYYAQRARAGLIISEATQSALVGGGGYPRTPGIYTDAQQAGWARIAESVHTAGGRIFLQMWHVGRVGHPDLHGLEPIAPSPVAATGMVRTPKGKVPFVVPRAMTLADIREVIAQFRQGARRAVDAGLDGIEIHGANGYLLHQFLGTSSNRRTDDYGGAVGNRCRFVLDLVAAVADEIGAERTAIRLSPRGGGHYGIEETETAIQYRYLLAELAQHELAYLHLMDDADAPMLVDFRAWWPGTLVYNTGFSGLRGLGAPQSTDYRDLEALVRDGLVDAVAVGRDFIANPDLIYRLEHGVPLAVSDPKRWYHGDEQGYIDYPAADVRPGTKAEI